MYQEPQPEEYTISNEDALKRYQENLDIILAPLLSKRGDYPLYHYTGGSALCSILKEQQLWLTKWNCLNDPTEFQLIHDIVENELKEYRNKDEKFFLLIQDYNSIERAFKNDTSKWAKDYNFFILSFTRKEDSLNMWSYYGKGAVADGYSILFKSKPYRTVTVKDEQLSCTVSLTPVTYSASEQRDYIQKALALMHEVYINEEEYDRELIIDELFCRLVHSAGCRFKHEKYEEEQEVRAIVELHAGQEKYISHRVSNGVIVPYIALKMCPHSISEICISPTLQKNAAMPGLVSIRKKLGLPFELKQSVIPYRNN